VKFGVALPPDTSTPRQEQIMTRSTQPLLPVWAVIILGLSWFLAGPAGGQSSPPESVQDRQEQEFKIAIDAVQAAAKSGPENVTLIDQGVMKLPKGYLFVPRAEADRLLRAMGNRTGSNFLGLILSADDGLRWFVTLNYNKSGYVKDDDAKDWKADELLEQLKEGTEDGNAERRTRGFPEIEVARWIAPPAYDSPTRRLVWSALVRDKTPIGGSTNDDEASVNYNTYALGREGFFQLNLVTNSKRIEQDRKHAGILLAALEYTDGKRYEDYVPGRDRTAEFGLAALVAGAAAKKLGLLAAAGVFLLKFWKIALIGAAGGFAVLGKLFKKKS
jgi:uncharacterized membrane-anchored protein